MEVFFAIYGCAAVRSMLLGLRLKSTASGWGVISPLKLNDPFSLILVSSDTFSGLARSRLTPSTCSASGASSTCAAGLVLRSSPTMLASFSSNRRRSNAQGEPAAEGALVASRGVPFAGGGDVAGAADNLSKLKDPSGSSHVTSLSPVIDNDSTCAWRFNKSNVAPLASICGTVIQSLSDCLGRTVRSETATLDTSKFRSTAYFSENRYVASTSTEPELISKFA